MTDINVNTGNTNDSNFDWKKYQKQGAKEAAIKNNLENMKGGFFCGIAFTGTAIAKELTNICDQMAETYDTALADEVKYEIEEETRSVEEIEKELQEVQNRIKELSEKQGNGTITEEEQAELDTLNGKSNDLKTELENAIADEILLSRGFKEEIEEQKSVQETAEEYADTTMDVGEDVVNHYKDKAEKFFSRIFGKNYEEQIEIGNNAISSGANLEAVVRTAEEMENITNEAIADAEGAADDAQNVADKTPTVETDPVPNKDEDKKKDEEK